VQVQRQLVLKPFKEEQDQNPDGRECQNAACIAAPRLFGLAVGADDAINGLLDFQVPRRGVDAVDVVAQRYMHRGQQRHEQNKKHDSRERGAHLRSFRKWQWGGVVNRGNVLSR
jgi:hypothetical protein